MGSEPRAVSASSPWQSEKELGEIKGPGCGGASSKNSPKLQEFVLRDPLMQSGAASLDGTEWMLFF